MDMCKALEDLYQDGIYNVGDRLKREIKGERCRRFYRSVQGDWI